MITILDNFNKKRHFSLEKPITVGVGPARNSAGLQAFYVSNPLIEPLKLGNFIGSIAEGGSCNCENLQITPHGQGTHTETIGHITKDTYYIQDFGAIIVEIVEFIRVTPKISPNGDAIIDLEQLQGQFSGIGNAVAIACLESKKVYNFSGTNPCYFTPEAMAYLVDIGFEHLLIDLPSVDREEDGGKLAAHKIWWSIPEKARTKATITEMAVFPNSLKPGTYGLIIGLCPLPTDAVPTMPLFFEEIIK